jgi:hypothetical protein
MGIKAH